MASFVTFTTLDGEQIDINAFDDAIANLRAVPSSVLDPLGLANGTYIEWTSGRKIGVQGTLAATAAALTAASYVTPAQLAAAIAAFAATLSSHFFALTGQLVGSAGGGAVSGVMGVFSTGNVNNVNQSGPRIPAGRLVRVRWTVKSNTQTAASVWTVQKNGADTAHTITVPALDTNPQVTTANVDYADGDVLSVSCGATVLAGTGGLSTIVTPTFEFSPIKP